MIPSNYSDEKNELIDIISDSYKDVNGFRPRGINYNKYRMGELQTILDELQVQFIANEKEEAIFRDEQVIVFEKLVQDTINYGAGDRVTALRWLFDGSDITLYSSQDLEHFVWQHHILFTKYGESIVQELIDIYKDEE